MNQSADFQWINRNYASLQAKYPNMYVAVKNGQVISANRDFGKTYNEAKKKTDDFATDFIMSGEPVVLSYLRYC
jgi:hypothetical protein